MSQNDALMLDNFLYTTFYDDVVNGTSQKSVKLLDDIFLKLVTEIFPCDTFIEAGAFDGQTSRTIQLVLPAANIYAFEANPYNYNEFKSLFNNTSINYMNVALSNQDGTATFKIHIKANGADITKIKGNDSLLTRTADNVEYENVTVPAVTLDSYFADKISSKDSVAMWIDLEGYAYQALESATSILANVDIIKIEVENFQFWENQKLDTDIRLFLSQYGFVPVLRDYEYPNQYNILFCKHETIESQKFQNLVTEYNLLKNISAGTISENNRILSIQKLYKDILNRDADEAGLYYYQNSNFSLADIENIFLKSEEYKNRK